MNTESHHESTRPHGTIAAELAAPYDTRAILREELAKTLDSKYSTESFDEIWAFLTKTDDGDNAAHHAPFLRLPEDDFRRYCRALAQRKLGIDLVSAGKVAKERADKLRAAIFVEWQLAHSELADKSMSVNFATGDLTACDCKESDVPDELIQAFLQALASEKKKREAKAG